VARKTFKKSAIKKYRQPHLNPRAELLKSIVSCLGTPVKDCAYHGDRKTLDKKPLLVYYRKAVNYQQKQLSNTLFLQFDLERKKE
jgi:hypothetical protein